MKKENRQPDIFAFISDQRHGFSERFFEDITNLHYRYMKNAVKKREKYRDSTPEVVRAARAGRNIGVSVGSRGSE